jgi:YD repeat-containing protein
MKAFFQTVWLGIFATVCLQSLHSQNKVSYGYDSAGNRVSRTIEVVRSSQGTVEEEPPVVYSEMLSDIELKIYPNPTEGLLNIEIYNLPEGQTANIWLYNLSGNLITSFKDVSDSVSMNISGQPAGIYLMKIMAGEYQTEWRIIKK